MKILMVNYEWPPLGGGGGVAMAGVAARLAERHEVHVLTSGTGDLPEQESLSPGNLTVHRTPVMNRNRRAVATISSMLSFYPQGLRLGRRLVAEIDFDVVNTWFAIPSGPTGVKVARGAGLPHLLTIIGGDIYDPSKWYSPHRNPVLRQVVRRVIHRADKVTSISADVARRAVDAIGVRSHVEVIPLGVDRAEFEPASRESLGLPEDGILLISLGRLVRRKDHPTVFRAMAALRDPRVHLVVVGDGPELEHLQRLAAELDIAGRVHFQGFVDDQRKHQLLAASDVFVLPSLHEGFGLVYLEAMHCGLPVIGASHAGSADFLENGVTGRMVSPGNVEALAGALRELVDSDQRRTTIGETNRGRALGFTVARTASLYEDCLERTVREVR